MARARRPGRGTLVVVLAAMLVVSAGIALAASPKPNGLYSGTVTANNYKLKVEVHVAASRKTATARFYCNGTTDPTSPLSNARAFPITKGTFNAQTKYDTWGIKGTFISATAARAILHVQATCSTSSSANYRLTLRLSSK